MKIHVGNLSGEISEENLKLAFEKTGRVVSVEIIKEKYNGRTKVFAFIEMDSEESAQSAINELNGKELKGRVLKVSKAIAKTEDPGRKKVIPGLKGRHGGNRGVSVDGKGGFGGGRGGYSGSKGGFGGKKGFSGGRGGRGR